MKAQESKFLGKIPISRHFCLKESHAIIQLSWFLSYYFIKKISFFIRNQRFPVQKLRSAF